MHAVPPAVNGTPLLTVDRLSVSYGTTSVLQEVSLEVRPGEVVTVLGSNGTGKSTLLRTISGLVRPRAGHIRFTGQRIDALAPKHIVRLGIAHCPEGRKVFPDMTVRENLRLGAYAVARAGDAATDMEHVYALFPRLRERERQRAGTLSGGEQQMLAVGRALMARPRLLMLDEPSLGLAPLVARQIFGAIRALNLQENLTVFLVEQNAFHALRLAHRGYVMVNGRITLSGTGHGLLARPEVKAAYLEGGRH
jgi:branched-chain amino acid transport system ATP-binding protein